MTDSKEKLIKVIERLPTVQIGICLNDFLFVGDKQPKTQYLEQVDPTNPSTQGIIIFEIYKAMAEMDDNFFDINSDAHGLEIHTDDRIERFEKKDYQSFFDAAMDIYLEASEPEAVEPETPTQEEIDIDLQENLSLYAKRYGTDNLFKVLSKLEEVDVNLSLATSAKPTWVAVSSAKNVPSLDIR